MVFNLVYQFIMLYLTRTCYWMEKQNKLEFIGTQTFIKMKLGILLGHWPFEWLLKYLIKERWNHRVESKCGMDSS